MNNSKTKHFSIKKVLVVGSWAKEEITIENIKKNPNIKIFSYLNTKNPGIISKVDGYRIGSLNNSEDIVDYAKRQNIDLVLITTAEPLSVGVTDDLEKQNIFVFAPSKKTAKLESDKAYARELMKKYKIDGLPKFKLFDNPSEAIQFAKNLNWEVAVKPVGLTEGLGVKIYGDQLENKNDVMDYINDIFNKKIGGSAKVLIEEKLEGDEFTIQCFVYGTQLITTPAIKDFKRLLPGDKGPNTASMGSYSDKGFLLPFITEYDYTCAVNIMKKTIKALTKDTGEICKGVLYGQFMKTNDELKLIEYNYRPGDPEWMNTITVLKDNLIDIIKNLMDKNQVPVNFEKKATICKYIVPKGYPKTMNQILTVKFDAKKINNLGVNIYYSSGLNERDELRVGTERGIAFVSKGNTILNANDLVEKAISMVDGDFHYRNDIGTKEMIK